MDQLLDLIYQDDFLYFFRRKLTMLSFLRIVHSISVCNILRYSIRFLKIEAYTKYYISKFRHRFHHLISHLAYCSLILLKIASCT